VVTLMEHVLDGLALLAAWSVFVCFGPRKRCRKCSGVIHPGQQEASAPQGLRPVPGHGPHDAALGCAGAPRRRHS